MIEIDLLPLELRKKRKISFNFEQMFDRKLLYSVLGYVLLFHLFLYAVDFINMARLNKIKKNRQGLSAQKAQIDQLQGALFQINKKVPLIEALISNRVLLSEKLNRIGDLIIAGIWLNEMSLKKEKANKPGQSEECLIIQGSAASRMENEPALIGRFMQGLKDDPSFSQDFTEIELGPIKKRQISQTEVMDFTLICWFKPEKAKALVK